jgi:hypothetical protein
MASPEVNVRIRAKDEATPVLQLIKGRLSEIEPAGARAGRGVEKIADGLKGLGREAIGVNRDVSNLLSGLLMFEGGGLVAAGAIAGLGAVALAFEFLTRKTREEQEANDKVVDSLAATAEQGNTTAQAIRNMDAAVSSLALHQSQLFELKNPTAAAGLFAGFGPGAAGGLGAALPFIARLIGLTEKEEEAVKRAGVATGQAGKGYVTSTMQASAEAVKFGHASDFVRRQLEAYLRTLRATAADESKTTDERNAAAKELDSLTSAMGKTVAKGQNLAQSLAEQVSYYGQLAQLHPLTSQQLDELTGVLNAVTAAEQDANTSRKDAIALLGAERQALALLGGEAAKQAEKDLRASVGRSPFTAPQRPADGRSLTPFAVPDGLIDTRSIISPSRAGARGRDGRDHPVARQDARRRAGSARSRRRSRASRRPSGRASRTASPPASTPRSPRATSARGSGRSSVRSCPGSGRRWSSSARRRSSRVSSCRPSWTR